MDLSDKDLPEKAPGDKDAAGRAGAVRDADKMGGFAKGLAVIEAFGKGRSAQTIADIARSAGLDRAVARRCLLTLVAAGYATTDGRLFELTPRILRLGHAYLAASLPRLIQPSLDALADSLRESCSASVLDGPEVVYIARASRHHTMGAGLHRGSRLPAYCTSMGRVLLASLPKDQMLTILKSAERPAITERTLTKIPELTAEIDRVRAQGYSIIDQEIETGSRSISAPVFNLSGQTVAAINVGAHAARATLERLETEVLPKLLETQRYLAGILP